ncbi:MAG: hypothetical protein Q9208_005647 [Pyrenodesmia sp. 3 TL-2023]
MISLLRFTIVLGVVHTAWVCAEGTIKMDWTTDTTGDNRFGPGGRLGPDGPWQAVLVSVGLTYSTASHSLMWPSGTSTTNILLADGRGRYSKSDANATSIGSAAESDAWLNPSNTSDSSYAHIHDDILIDQGTDLIGPYNASIYAYHQWDVSFPNGHNYTARAGILGLGPSESNPLSFLGQMKAGGTIASTFCGLHMGSALLGQAGSMILGGYEQNRVLGDVGTFDLQTSDPNENYLFIPGPLAFLLDVVLDVETGGSPFNESSSISLWPGINDTRFYADQSRDRGGRTGSRLISFNPSVPYMYLPQGICKTAAQYLPLTWDAGLELYTWNIGEDASRIIGSPAYMAFVLADIDAKNVTIKVPFQLLNLTLLPPIVDTPTQYFPCDPKKHGPYVLGRAFLQAAFLGFEFEHNLAYIAQAPGPTMEQSIIKTYQPNSTSVIPNSLGTFASSWASSWKILDNDTTTNTSNSDGTTVSQPTSSSSGGGLPGGAAAGVAVGCVLGALAIVAAASFLWRKRKKMPRQTMTDKTSEATTAPPSDQTTGDDGYPTELAHCQGPSEAYGNAPPHEMVEDGVLEAPHQPSRHELPLRRSW